MSGTKAVGGTPSPGGSGICFPGFTPQPRPLGSSHSELQLPVAKQATLLRLAGGPPVKMQAADSRRATAPKTSREQRQPAAASPGEGRSPQRASSTQMKPLPQEGSELGKAQCESAKKQVLHSQRSLPRTLDMPPDKEPAAPPPATPKLPQRKSPPSTPVFATRSLPSTPATASRSTREAHPSSALSESTSSLVQPGPKPSARAEQPAHRRCPRPSDEDSAELRPQPRRRSPGPPAQESVEPKVHREQQRLRRRSPESTTEDSPGRAEQRCRSPAKEPKSHMQAEQGAARRSLSSATEERASQNLAKPSQRLRQRSPSLAEEESLDSRPPKFHTQPRRRSPPPLFDACTGSEPLQPRRRSPRAPADETKGRWIPQTVSPAGLIRASRTVEAFPSTPDGPRQSSKKKVQELQTPAKTRPPETLKANRKAKGKAPENQAASAAKGTETEAPKAKRLANGRSQASLRDSQGGDSPATPVAKLAARFEEVPLLPSAAILLPEIFPADEADSPEGNADRELESYSTEVPSTMELSPAALAEGGRPSSGRAPNPLGDLLAVPAVVSCSIQTPLETPRQALERRRREAVDRETRRIAEVTAELAAEHQRTRGTRGSQDDSDLGGLLHFSGLEQCLPGHMPVAESPKEAARRRKCEASDRDLERLRRCEELGSSRLMALQLREEHSRLFVSPFAVVHPQQHSDLASPSVDARGHQEIQSLLERKRLLADRRAPEAARFHPTDRSRKADAPYCPRPHLGNAEAISDWQSTFWAGPQELESQELPGHSILTPCKEIVSLW